MVKVIMIIGILVVGVGAVALLMREPPSPYDLPAATVIDPPSGAVILSDDVRAADVLRPVMAARGEDAIDEAKAEWVGSWTPLRGWSGGVKVVEVRTSSTWFSVEMFDSTIIGQQFYLEVEVPGGLPHIGPGTAVTVRGRIKDIVPSPNPALIPGRIRIDQATVISPVQ